MAILSVDRFGCKPLMIVGSLGTAFAMFLLGLASYFHYLRLAFLFSHAALYHHGFSYWIYALMGLLSAPFVWKFVP